MKIILKELKLTNFKCYKNAVFKFSEDTNEISGETGLGKTTVKDAYLWCLGVDCNFAPRVDDYLVKDVVTEVEVVLSLDGVETKLLRKSTQKWKNEDFNGNDSTFFIDNIKKGATEYKQELARLFGVETYTDVKILADLESFNNDSGTKWTWKERREYLFKLFQIEGNLETLQHSKDYQPLWDDFIKKHNEVDIQKSINGEKNGIKTQYDRMKVLIQDRENSITQYSQIDFKALENDKEMFEQDLRDLENDKVTLKAQNVTRTQDKQRALENDKRLLEQTNQKYTQTLSELEVYKNAEFNKKCSHCGQELPTDQIAKKQAEFELGKMGKIAELEGTAENCLKIAKELEGRISCQETEQSGEKGQNIEYFDYVAQLSKIDNEINNTKMKLSDVNEQLYKKKLIENFTNEVAQLKTKTRELANDDKLLVEKQNALTKYIEQKVALVTEYVNHYFKNVKFKFFKFNNATAENEYSLTCECLYNGVAYNNLSQGQKISADFEVNSVLQQLWGISVPQFIDNKQDNTFDLQSTSQVINLVTTKKGNINASFIKDSYSLADCDIKGGKNE